MFAVPEYTVLPPFSSRVSAATQMRHAAASPLPAPPAVAAIVRSIGADQPCWHGLLAGTSQFATVALPHEDPRVRVWLSGWPPGQRDSFRYEAPQGAFAVLSGLVEERTGGDTRILRPDQIRIFGPGYRHWVQTAGPVPAVTVHVQVGCWLPHLSPPSRTSPGVVRTHRPAVVRQAHQA